MLIRKIASFKRWDSTEIPNLITRENPLFTGDAISDLRTSGNTISVWETPDLAPANVAPILATLALNGDKLNKVVYVALDENYLKKKKILVNPVIGQCNSVVDQSILQRHRDISEVDYWHLGYLAEYIFELVKNNKYYSATLSEIKTYIKDLIQSKKVDPAKMNASIRKQLGY